MTIYLYVKTHNKTGLKYLGKTEQDPHNYKGSGKFWKQHIKQHGNDVSTTVIHECLNNDEIKALGLYYSKLWNVVKSNEWANLKEEAGDGFGSDQIKRLWQQDEYRDKMTSLMSETMKSLWNDPVYKNMKIEQYSERAKRLWKNDEYRSYILNHLKKIKNDPEHKIMMSDRMSGSNNPGYDTTLYNFVHISGKQEYCTRYELYTKYTLSPSKICLLLQGERKSHKGWSIKR